MTLQQAPVAGRSTTPPDRALSLEWKLPLLMTGALAAILGLSLALTYGALTRSAEQTARERLTDAARLIAPTVGQASALRAAALWEAAHTEAVRAVLATPGAIAAPGLVERARTRIDSALGPSRADLRVELRDAAGRTAVRFGPPSRAVDRLALGDISWARLARADTAIFTPLYAAEGRIYFWIVVPVRDGARHVGSLAAQRFVSGGRGDQRLMQGLVGKDVALYLRNGEGPRLWTTAPGAAVDAPVRRDSSAGGLRLQRPNIGWMVAVEQPAPPTPYVAVLETPLREVLAPARRTTAMLAGLSLVLVALGALLSWAISRRITRPMVQLTEAAESLARGESVRRVWVASGDELGRLAASFHGMALEVAGTRAELERQIAEADVARREAEAANRAKGDFLAVMSHELRTPLNAIGGYAQLLELGIYGPVTAEQQDALARLGRSQAHLLRLIEDVLSFAKIDAGQVEYAIVGVPLDDALAGLEALVAPQVRAKSLAFRYRPCDPALVARADRERLQQIVLNLLTNAVKFTPPGGSVELEAAGDDGAVYVRVRDTGPGVAPERVGDIFEPFVQGERSLSRPSEGVGLGLAISRDLARGMGGDVSVESAAGAGATFTLRLPRHGVPAAHRLPAPGLSARARASP